MAQPNHTTSERAWRLWLPTLFDSEEANRRVAAQALGESGDPEAIIHLLAALQPSLGMIAGGGDVARALVELREVWTVEAFSTHLADDRGYVRRASAEALGWLNDVDAVEALMEALGDPDVGVRIEASWALGRIGDLTAVATLIAALGDPDANVRRSVCDALGALADPKARPALGEALIDPDAGVRAAAEDALTKLIPETG
jgi:HEAT repeat protein